MHIMRVVSLLMVLVAACAGQQFAVRRPLPQQPLQQQRRQQQFIDGTPFGSGGPPPPQRFRTRPPPGQRRPPPQTFFKNQRPVNQVRRPIAPSPPRPPPQEFQPQFNNIQNQRNEQNRHAFEPTGPEFEQNRPEFEQIRPEFEQIRPEFEQNKPEFEPFPIPSHLGGVGGLPLNPRPEFNNPFFEPSEGPTHPGEDIQLDDSDFITIGVEGDGVPTPPDGFLSDDPQLQEARSSPEPLSKFTEPTAATPQTEVTEENLNKSSVTPPSTTTTTTTTTRATTKTPVAIISQTQQQQQRQEVFVEVSRPHRQSPPAPRPFSNLIAPTAPQPQTFPPRRQFRPEPLESNDILGFVDSIPQQEAQEAREQLLQREFLGDYQDPQLRPDSFYDYAVEYDVDDVDNENEKKPDRLALLLLNSSFTCVGMKGGYYADEEVQCEVFHYCQDNIKHSWLCPEGASFHQVHLICMPRAEDNICEKSSKFHFVNDFLYKELEYENSNSSKAYADRYYPEDFEEGLAHLEGKTQNQAPLRHGGPQQHQQNQRVPTGVAFHNADEVDIPFVRRHPPPFDGPRLPHNQPTRFSDYDDVQRRRQQR
ncbi:unnamed protein product [Meganyctiphanes norvegica]|uniref:Chitin-binding type-2 domain-containing protein n=1 Tax=Meganyctiphanes norvegica TaxID=48144 RepID=A0AAV2QXV5_MEGNR